MSASMFAAEGDRAISKNPQPSKHKSGKKAGDPSKAMNTMFALSRPAARIIKELYVRLDEGVNRSIYNFGKKFIQR
jgi:hypothetical protein